MICLPAPFPGWPRDRADWKGAAPRPALTQQSGRRESGPRGGASVLPPGIAAPTWGREAGAALPSLCAPAAWLAAYFPSWQASRCRQGNACGELFILSKFAVGQGGRGGRAAGRGPDCFV